MGVLTFGDNLTNFFHGDTLVRMWPDLSPRLPQEVRAAWEEQHLVLRARAAAVSSSCFARPNKRARYSTALSVREPAWVRVDGTVPISARSRPISAAGTRSRTGWV